MIYLLVKRAVYLYALLALLSITGCNTYFYGCTSNIDYYINADKNSYGSTGWDNLVTHGTTFYTKNRNVKNVRVQVGTHGGYLYKPKFISYRKTKYKTIPLEVALRQDDTIFGGRHGNIYGLYYPNARQNASSSYNGGPVQVKGYYRKDGTYVKPYSRRAPSRH